MFTICFADTMLSQVMKQEIVRESSKTVTMKVKGKKIRVYLIELTRLIDQLRESTKKRKKLRAEFFLRGRWMHDSLQDTKFSFTQSCGKDNSVLDLCG